MNYRHAYHAGNFADCFKHAILVWLLLALARKEKPFCVLDTHAGCGEYDLTADPALRTGEAGRGIFPLCECPPAVLEPYVHLVRDAANYPGSPALIRKLLRPGDRAVLCELHPEDHAALRRFCARDHRMGVHLRDGYAAIRAFLPPGERRGLTFIDPPYEAPDEFLRVAEALRMAHERFAGGVIAAWYPIKHRAPARHLLDTLRASALCDTVAVELCLRHPVDPTRLNGCGMVLVNPPFGFAADILPMLTALLDRLGDRELGEATAMVRLTDE